MHILPAASTDVLIAGIPSEDGRYRLEGTSVTEGKPAITEPRVPRTLSRTNVAITHTRTRTCLRLGPAPCGFRLHAFEGIFRARQRVLHVLADVLAANHFFQCRILNQRGGLLAGAA